MSQPIGPRPAPASAKGLPAANKSDRGERENASRVMAERKFASAELRATIITLPLDDLGMVLWAWSGIRSDFRTRMDFAGRVRT
jgi:hypothetical protein